MYNHIMVCLRKSWPFLYLKKLTYPFPEDGHSRRYLQDNSLYFLNSFPSVSSVQSLSPVWLFATPWAAACQVTLSITNTQSSPKPMSIESVMPSNYLVLCRLLLLLPSIFLSIRVFSSESALQIRWPKYCRFSFNISPSNEHPGLISFRMGWLDLLAVQGTLNSLLQHHSSKASILLHSAFFIVQLSHAYMTTGKTIALTRQTFVDKAMSLPLALCSIKEPGIQTPRRLLFWDISLPCLRSQLIFPIR